MITILNKRNNYIRKETVVPIHRPSSLGNPFYLKDVNNDIERDKVCDQYDVWFIHKLRSRDSLVLAELARIRGILEAYGEVQLLCFCAPKRCHGATIKAYLEQSLY